MIVADEDPETFGAGHFVLYPLEKSHSRLAIEEQYAPGVAWQDEDRLPTSWLWRMERLIRDASGAFNWTVTEFGEVASDDVDRLVRTAERWAKRIETLRPPSAGINKHMQPPAAQTDPPRL